MTDYSSTYTGAQVDSAVAAIMARKLAIISDTKAAGTNGGTFTSGAWRTRDLNTEDSDPDGIVSVSGNQFTLQPGTYCIDVSAPAYVVNRHQIRIRDITNGVTVAVGSSAYTHPTATTSTLSKAQFQITLAAATVFEIQHRCETTAATYGLGVASNFGESEKYTICKIEKLA